MNIRSTTLRLIVSACLLAGTAAFGQVTFTWTNSLPLPLDLAGPTNWNPNGVPSGTDANVGDTMQFDGQSTGPVAARSNTGGQTGFSGAADGLIVHLTANQTSPVLFYTTLGTSSGVRMQSVQIDAGAGSFTIGDNTANAFDTIWGGTQGQIHEFQNNSSNPAYLNPNFRIRYGGGGTHTLVFDGSGDWYCSNSLFAVNNSTTIISYEGTGTMYYYATNVPNDFTGGAPATLQPGSPFTISSGKVVLLNSAVFSANLLGGPIPIANSGFLEYNDVQGSAGSGRLTGIISGPGSIQVNNGVLTLAAQSTYTGSNILTGGELIAGIGETAGVSGPLGVGGTISFFGGTLGHGPNNAFDYSSRFDPSANQAFNIDTGGAFVAYASALASSGCSLSKLGAGTLTLTGTNSYTGPTAVTAGKLVFQGPMSGTGNITVSDGAILGVFNTGTQVSPGALTLGSSAGCILEFNNVSNTLVAPLAAGTLASGGSEVININSGTFTVGASYPLISWTSGTAPAVTLGLLNGYIGNLSTNGNIIQLNIVATAFSWTGSANALWDLSSVDWLQNGGATVITNNAPAIFNDDSSVTNITISTLAAPTVATFNNDTNPYTVTSSGGNNLGGSAGYFMAGSGTVTLSGGANTYTGVTTLNGGTTIVSALANGGTASDIGEATSTAGNIVFNGGALQYTGTGASIDRLFTLNSFGGTIDNEGSGALTLSSSFTNGMTGGGPRGLTLTGVNTNILASVVPDGSGATSLTKQGTGTWILAGNNTYSGLTEIDSGTLQVGNAGGSGSVGNSAVVDNSALVFNRTGSVTVVGAVSGTGSVTQNGTGTAILANNNTFSGGLTINAGAVQIGNGGATGQLYPNGAVTNNALLIFNSTGDFTLNTAISGTGNLIVRGAGGTFAPDVVANTYTGWTEIDPGATFQPVTGNAGGLASPVVTNNGTFLLIRQDNGAFIYPGAITGSGRVVKANNNFNAGDVTLTGVNTNNYTGGTLISGGFLILGDGVTAGSGAIWPTNGANANVTFTNDPTDDRPGRGLIFNRPDSFTFTNNIVGKTTITGGGQGNAGTVYQFGGGTVTLIGNNSYQGGTTVSNGTLVVGKGGFTGTVGSGPIIVSPDSATGSATLVFNRVDNNLNITRGFSGTNGFVIQEGTGEVTLNDVNSTNFAGVMVVSNGTLAANATGGDMDVAGGNLAVGALNTTGTLVVASNLNISAGEVTMALNSSSAQSSSFVLMTNIYNTNMYVTNADTSITTNVITTYTNGFITYTGGTLKLLNFGPALTGGERFVLFSEPVAGGASMPIVAPGGYTFNNNLAFDGSVSVATITPPGANHITPSRSGNQLVLSWPAGWTGVHLQAQTNSLTGSNWVNIPGSDLSNSYTNTIAPGITEVFFRTVLE